MSSRISTDNIYSVYIHVNKVNGKCYIGRSANVKDRWRCNGKNYYRSQKFFQAIKKYGWNNFYHEVLKENLYIDEADSLEAELIWTFDTINSGYNDKSGGLKGKLSPEALKRMGDGVHKAFTEHPEIKEKIRQKALGRIVSEETRKKIGLNGNRTILVNIDGEIGSIRYWAKRINMTHYPLIDRKEKYGMEYMIEFIKGHLQKQAN